MGKQKFVNKMGMLVAYENENVCIMWNLGDKTRLWAHPCGEYRFSLNDDKTITSFHQPGKCFYHKMNGFVPNEKVYVTDCYQHDRFRWKYTESGQLMNWNRYTT